MSVKEKLFDAGRDAWKILKVLVVVSVPVSFLLFHVYNQYQLTSLGYEVSEQTTEHRRLMEQNRRLSIEAAYQGRTERMLSVARDQFGLEPVEPEQVIEVDLQDEPTAGADSTREAEYATLESASAR